MVMDFLCCDPMERGYGDDHDDETETGTCSTDEGILECDYDAAVTRLYHGIEERQWEEVLYFLETGKWYNTSIISVVFGDYEDDVVTQARTWVTALDEGGNVRWCQLPLHAAVTFLAPHAVVQKLIEIYPKSIRCADDQDMLPLHYAFRFGAEDDVLVLLLEKFPQAVGKLAVKDRLPLDLAQYGPRPERGILIDYYMQSAVRNAKAEWDRDYENMAGQMKSESDAVLALELNDNHKTLAQTVEELNILRKELELAKREATLDKREHEAEFGVKGARSFSSRASSKSNRSNRSINPNNSSTHGRRVGANVPLKKKKAPLNQIVEIFPDDISKNSKSTHQKPPLDKKPQPVDKTDDYTLVSRRSGFGQLFGKRKKQPSR
jgi:hypothetical protein